MAAAYGHSMLADVSWLDERVQVVVKQGQGTASVACGDSYTCMFLS